MSSEEPDLPHDWSVWECSGCGVVMETEAEIAMHLGRKDNYSEEPMELQLTEKSDAEESIKEARQQERHKILNKIDRKMKQVDRLGEQYGSEMNADMIKNELEELLEELEEGVEEV